LSFYGHRVMGNMTRTNLETAGETLGYLGGGLRIRYSHNLLETLG
jgi:hypothetical protein